MMHVARPDGWAVVVPAYGHPEDTVACLQSVLDAQSSPGYLILVDDASADDSVERVAAWAQRAGLELAIEDESHVVDTPLRRGLTILESKRNEGFTLSANKGLACALRRTPAPFVLLLNNDAVVQPGFFVELAASAAMHPGAGLLTGTIYEWDGSTVWFAGGRIIPLRAIAAHDTERRPGGVAYETEWISGCAMLISRAVLERIGTLPVCFSPCYSEDVDYSLRARAAGFRLLVAPRAAADHRVGVSLGRHGAQDPRVTYVSSRNRVFVVRRNYRGWQRAGALAYLLITKPVRAVVETLRGRPRAAWALLAGTVDGLFNPAAKT